MEIRPDAVTGRPHRRKANDSCKVLQELHFFAPAMRRPTHLPVVAQVLQVALVLLFAPVLKGYIDRLKARGMGRVGPPILQPYRNLWKLFGKERLRGTESTWISRVAPVLYFSAPLIVTLLIPVLTTFPLPLAFMADMLGGGMILGAGGVILLLASADSGSPYTGIAVSRMRFIATLAEPLTIAALFGAAAVGGSTIPYVVNQKIATSGVVVSHVLIAAAWLLLILAEAGRIPVDNPDSSQELSLIDPNRTFEFTGPDLALFEWGGWMKFTVLGIVLVNVLLTPLGLAPELGLQSLLLAILATCAKLLVLGTAIAFIEMSFAKLRLLRIAEFLTVATAIAALGSLVIRLIQ